MRASSAGAERDAILESPEQPSVGHSSAEPSSAEWKKEANRRLEIHRARRNDRASRQSALPGMEAAVAAEARRKGREQGRQGQDEQGRDAAPTQNKSVAERVAARYAKAPTYSEMLANEARNAARAAEAAAVAAGEARDAAQAILVGLDVGLDDGLDAGFDIERGIGRGIGRGDGEDFAAAWPGSSYGQAASSRGPDAPRGQRSDSRPDGGYRISEAVEDEDEEPVAPVQPLPAKLIEFPRELVAARKARPRLVEGPLREEYDREPPVSQLRIFEVEQEAISTAPAAEPVAADWSPIRLDASPAIPVQDWLGLHPESALAEDPLAEAGQDRAPASGLELPLQTASLEDRLMAGLVDAALIVGGFLVFVLVFAACTAHPPTGKPALIAGGAALCAFAAIYLLLFFNFGTDTPGMRYARIALCTFDDENPTRGAMRRRLAALLLSAVPLGLGVLWAFFDDDRLGWHDRISRTYQRSYR